MTDSNIWWIIILVFVFGGLAVSSFRDEIERRHQRKLEIANGPQPVCGCGDHYAYHNPKTGQCGAVTRQAVVWDKEGDASAWDMVKCQCQRYTGPEPLETMYLPEITGSYTKKDDA